MNATAFRPRAATSADQSRPWPKVSLHLPLRDAAPEAVRRTLESVGALDYPALEVLVVDTHTADPGCWEAAAEYCALLGPQFRFFHLGTYPGFRAGALNFALGETAGDAAVVGVLKAGQVVRPGWLRGAVPALARNGVGTVRSPLLPAGAVLADATMPVPDELTLFRVEALRGAGGWNQSSLSPDAELNVTLMRQGWDTARMTAPMGQDAPSGSADDVASRRHRQVAGLTAALRARPGLLLSPRDRSLTGAQRRELSRAILPLLADAAALAGVLVSLVLVALALWDEDWAQPLPVLLALGLPGLLPLAQGGMRNAWRDGRATWQGLLGGTASRAEGLGLERSLAAALVLAALGLAAVRPWGVGETLLVVAMLIAQAAPGMVAICPAPRAVRWPARRRHVA
ncbi:glycosyltransferase [Roseomonas haemaphysalidis]|uniref:Glycosyltransferase 2-like domain-containing protein n=1 Tax=Roseomonas haemaphysalidis TaxID=2768162 RepID=A0ABS3KTH5_9PROT|nr:glycosyltransferase [Roseomonas haemaphysalidis]MBO1079611.1 hypothetical protein [Roseomonas haemaphysalidis]